MANIALISCVKKKGDKKMKARCLYTSNFFVKSLLYAEKILKADKIFILSAKHGLLTLDEEIEPYEETLNDKNRDEQRKWAKFVYEKIEKSCDAKNDMFNILAGKKYYQDLIAYLPKTQVIAKNLPLYKKNQWLKRQLDE